MSGRSFGMRVRAYLTLSTLDKPVDVEAWEDYADTDTWCLRIGSPAGDLVIQADDPELIETQLSRWAALAREQRLEWKRVNSADTWTLRNSRWEALRHDALRLMAANPWTSRAAMLIASLSYAVEIEWSTPAERRRAVVRQVLTHDAEPALHTLESQLDTEARHVLEVLEGVLGGGREARQVIWAVACDALDAYRFDPDEAVVS
jgi:hypothetical protein